MGSEVMKLAVFRSLAEHGDFWNVICVTESAHT